MITVLAGGQDFEPTGLNYTGSGPSWSRRTVAELLPRIFAKSKKIAFIEWHTGLGPSGELSHLCSFAPGSAPYERVFDWMGAAARTSFAATIEVTIGETLSYRGLFSTWLPYTEPPPEGTGVLNEENGRASCREGGSKYMDTTG